MSIKAGRIREHANRYRYDNLRLVSERSVGLLERKPIGADAEDSQHLWLIKRDFGTQLLATLRELVGAQLGRCYGCTVYEIGNAITKGQ